MIQIVRDENGKHWEMGKFGREVLYLGQLGLYRKTTPVRAIQLFEPFSVETLEGTMEGKAGDYLMIGINGEMYPCDAEIFAKTYEPVEAE